MKTGIEKTPSRRTVPRTVAWAVAASAALWPGAEVWAGQAPTLAQEMIPADMPPEVRELVVELYGDTTDGVVAAARRLGEMGPKAVSAAPFLASMLTGHSANREPNQAAESLIKIGIGASDAVAAALNPAVTYLRHRVLHILTSINPQRAVPILVELLGSDVDRDDVLRYLRKVAGEAGEYVLAAAQSGDVKLRRGAALALPVCIHPPAGSPARPPAKQPDESDAKRILDLLMRLAKDPDTEVRANALWSLTRLASRDRKMPAPLTAEVREALRDQSAEVRKQALEVALQAQETDQTKYDALEPLAGDPDLEVRLAVMSALGLLPGRRERAVALMLKSLMDANAAVRERAALVLGRMRATEAEGQLLKVLQDPSISVQAAVALALGRCGGKAGVEAVMRLAKAEDPLFRFEAARALSERCLDQRGVTWCNRLTLRMTGGQNPWSTRSGLSPVPPALRDSFPFDSVRELMMELLEGPDTDQHAVAAEALIEGSRSPTVPDNVLLAALKSPSKIAWLVAVLHLEQVRSVPDQRFLEPLRRCAREGGGWPASDGMALSILVRMRDTETVLACCERILRNNYSKIACGAAPYLAALGEPGLDLLLKHLGDRRPDVRETIIKALAPQADQPRVKTFIQAALKSDDDRLRQGAERVMALVPKESGLPAPPKKHSRPAAPPKDGSPRVRPQPAQVAGLDNDRPDVAALCRELLEESVQVRAQAAETLGKQGVRQAVPALMAALQDPEEGVREAAAAALGRLGGPEAAEALLAALQSPAWGLRRAAAAALGGLDDAASAEALRKALSGDQHWCVRRAAAAALGRKRDGRPDPILIAALEDEHWLVRLAAHQALLAVTGQKLGPEAEAWRKRLEQAGPGAPRTGKKD